MQNKIKVVFCGTPKIGADVLKALIEMNQVEIVLVISQPDKPIGRKKQIVHTPVKKLALENNLKVLDFSYPCIQTSIFVCYHFT